MAFEREDKDQLAPDSELELFRGHWDWAEAVRQNPEQGLDDLPAEAADQLGSELADEIEDELRKAAEGDG